MPTVMREGGFEISIKVNDHFPAHAHVRKGRVEIRVNLENWELMTRNPRMAANDVRQARRLVYRHADLLRKEWVRIHGTLQRTN
jgi:hypothetical protein